MKRTTLYPLLVALVTLSVVGCTTSEKEIPAPTAQTATSDYSYAGYNIPEPMVEIASDYRGSNNNGQKANNLYTLGQTQVTGGHKIYCFFQTLISSGGPNPYGPYNSGTWSEVPGPNGGGAVKIAFANNTMYVVTDQNELWQATNVTLFSNPTWTRLPVQAVDVAASGTYVYFLGTANVGGGHPIYSLSNGVATEVVPGGGAVELAVDAFGRPWLISNVRSIFVGPMPGGSGGYMQVNGLGVDIASTGSTIAVLGNTYYTHGSEVYTLDVSDPNIQNSFVPQGGEATRITGSAGGNFIVMIDNGNLYKAN